MRREDLQQRQNATAGPFKIRQICELQRRPPDDAGSHELAGSNTKQVEALQRSTYKEGEPLKEKEVDKLHNRAMVDA
jgi:hypothetical protein